MAEILRTLVVTSCTSKKMYCPDNQLVQADFKNKSTLLRRETELSEYVVPACKMYKGMQHQCLMQGIDILRQTFGEKIIDLYIISAGYGLISEKKKVAPYEVTFSTMSREETINWSNQIGIHKDLNNLISEYDLIFFLLGDKYLRSIELPLESAKDDQKILCFASRTSKEMIPSVSPYFFIEVGQKDAASFGYSLVGLKGYLFKLLSEEIKRTSGLLLESIYEDPSYVMKVLEPYRRKIKDKDV